MTVFFEIDAVPSLLDVRAPQGRAGERVNAEAATLVAALQRAYAQRVARYHVELANALRVNASEAFGMPESAFPQVTLNLDKQNVTLAIDEDLYTALFDLYLFYGPTGVGEVAAAIQRQAALGPDVALAPARRFFTFTRNMLTIVIRETLIQIEISATERLLERLNSTSRTLSAAALGPLRATLVRGKVVYASDVTGDVEKEPDRYVLTDRDVARELSLAIRPALAAREKLSRLIRDKAGDDQISASARAFARSQQDLYGVTPLALLVVPGMRPESQTGDLEDVLVRTIYGLATKVDEMARAAMSPRSRIRHDLAGVKTSADISDQQREAIIEHLYIDDMTGIQHKLISLARSRIDDDPGYAAMLHPPTLLSLLISGTVAPGTFEHSVLHHWLTALETERAARGARRSQQRQALSVASASLSLIALVAPPVAPVAFVADVALLAFTIFSVAESLTGLEEAVMLKLPDFTEADPAALAAVGEAVAELTAYRVNLSVEIATQLVLLPVAQIRSIAGLMRGIAYFNDVRSLYQEAFANG